MTYAISKMIGIIILFISFFLYSSICIGQRKIYNNNVINPKNKVYFNIHVDTQIVYNPPPRKANLYLLDVVEHIGDKGEHELILTIGNPDGQIVYDSDWDLEFRYGYDTAYYDESPYINTLDKFGIRDRQTKFSSDKKHISFKASYIGANHVFKLIVIVPYWKNAEMILHRIGKLW